MVNRTVHFRNGIRLRNIYDMKLFPYNRDNIFQPKRGYDNIKKNLESMVGNI